MDSKVKKSCPNCSQNFFLKPSSNQQKGRIPLLLPCGHTVCELCIRNIIKFTEPIECQICHKSMDLPPCNQLMSHTDLYAVFPVNIYMLGELTLQQMEAFESKALTDNDCFIDLKNILKTLDNPTGICGECRGVTHTMCEQCGQVMCKKCMQKTHTFHVFKDHTLKNIDLTQGPNLCKTHKEKPLDYYCKDCKKLVCMDCMIVGGEKSCKSHNVVSAEEINEATYEQLNDITPKVDETFRRLTKTAVDIGYLLKDIDINSGKSQLNKIRIDVQNHFAKLHAAVQKHEQEVIDLMKNLKRTEKNSLLKAKDNVAEAIKESKTLLNKIKSVMEAENKPSNILGLLESAQEIIKTPWYLARNEECDNVIKAAVNEDLCSLISDYVHLEGNANSAYKLCSTAEIGENVEIPPAPSQPVFPPDLIKDVREMYKPKQEYSNVSENRSTASNPEVNLKQMPRYRSKYGSNSSINSLESDSSFRNSVHGISEQGSHMPVVHVPPFKETYNPKELVEGSQEVIFISHIVGPHNFFVQRACHQDLVKELHREYRNSVSLSKPSPGHITEGKQYLAFNKAHREWQRCRIINIDTKTPEKPLYQVFCIDFGNTEVVNINELRVLPYGRFSPPPLAINCALANCEPKGGVWTTEDSVLIQKIIDNKRAVIHVRRVRTDRAQAAQTLECDVTTFEDGVSLAHALVFHERARMPNPKLRYLKMQVQKPRLFLSTADLTPKSIEEVIITHIVSPDKFFVRKTHLQKTYEKICDDLEAEYSMSDITGTVYYPEVGTAYAAYIENVLEDGQDGGWRRAIVQDTPGGRRARLLLPDSGHVLLLHYTALRHLQPRFTVQRALATECHLSGITAVNKRWSNGSVALLERFLLRPLELQVEEAGRGGSVGVSLYERGETDLCINSEMCRLKYAVAIGIFMFNKNIPAEEHVHTQKTPLDKPKPVPKKEKLKILKRDDALPTTKVKDDDLQVKDKGPIKLEVKVLSCQSPSLVYVALIDQQKVFKELYDHIQEYYTKKTVPGKEKWKVGDRCCAVYEKTKTWRRAIVTELKDDRATVFFTDFACADTMPVTNLKELVPEFTKIGDAAIKCHLSGIMPAVGDKWPSLTNELLAELVEAYQRIFITKNGAIKDRSLPVELWVYHVIQGDALEPNKAEWRCLNKNIIDQGLGVPNKSQALTVTEKEDADQDMISFLNVTGSVHEWLQQGPFPTQPRSPLPPGVPDTSSPIPLEEERAGSNTMFVSDWLPPEPLKTQEFTGVPTYIDNDGVIYLHDVTQIETLDLIRKALEVKFANPDPKAKYVKWSVGQPCIARFYLDKRFYRGRVLEVNEQSSTCLIHYVDYGNEESCAFEDMRKTIVLYQIPVQAHRCILSRVKPKTGQWDKTTLDYIHKSIVEKECFVRATEVAFNDITPVLLKIDKIYIQDLLVDLDMAVYTDGTKPVVQKYVPIKPKNVEVEYTVESDSGPDFIVEEDETTEEPLNESTDTFDITSFENKDWNQLMEEDENKEIAGNYATFAKTCIDDEFPCNIVFVNDTKLELGFIHSNETELLYNKMFDQIQEAGATLPDIKGIYENKACIALFQDDQNWYRACILQYSKTQKKVKVKYVDFGNIEIVSIGDVKEIRDEWIVLPPASVSVQLYGLQMNPSIDVASAREESEKAFLTQETLRAKIVKKEGATLYVELRNNEGLLVYENLIGTVFQKIED